MKNSRTTTMAVSHTLRYSMQKKTATMVQTELMSCAMDWAMSCRSVSVSLV
jgi:hypothetical protein